MIPTVPGLYSWESRICLLSFDRAPVVMLYEVKESTGDMLAEGLVQVDVRSCWCVPRTDRAYPMVL